METAIQSHAIHCKGVTKTYGDGPCAVHALRGVDLILEAGELLMIVGPSGSGKTTLISVIAGILNQDQGECLVFGKNLKEMSDLERTNYRGDNIGFVFQAFNLIPMLTARENVAVPLLLNGVEQREALARAGELLSQYGLEEGMLDRSPNDLSGGQQQRVAIARSCIHEPNLIVCDEPTSNLDHETGVLVMELFRQEVLKKHRALAIVTHDSRIFSYADRIVKLDDGRIIANNSSKDP